MLLRLNSTRLVSQTNNDVYLGGCNPFETKYSGCDCANSLALEETLLERYTCVSIESTGFLDAKATRSLPLGVC